MVRILVLFLMFTSTGLAWAQDAAPAPDPRVLNEEDLEKLVSKAVGLVAKCPDLKGKKTVALREIVNSTDESIDKKQISSLFQTHFKKVSPATTLDSKVKPSEDALSFKMELTSKKSQSGNLHTGRYRLKVILLEGKREACTMESKLEKVGQI